jgi:hypothetical protein
MSQDVTSFEAGTGDDGDAVSVGEWRREIDQVSIHPRRQGILREAFAHVTSQVEGAGTGFQAPQAAVGELYVEIRHRGLSLPTA